MNNNGKKILKFIAIYKQLYKDTDDIMTKILYKSLKILLSETTVEDPKQILYIGWGNDSIAFMVDNGFAYEVFFNEEKINRELSSIYFKEDSYETEKYY